MKYKVVARTGVVQDKGKSLSAIGAQLVESPLLTEDEIIKVASDADAVIVTHIEPYTRRTIEGLKNCKIISRQGIGLNNIDLVAATEHGIIVAYVPDASVEEVSNHAITLILCFARKIMPVVQFVKEGKWQPGGKDVLGVIRPLNRLSEQALGLVGLGRIGRAVCSKAKALGMKVLVYDPYVPAKEIDKLGAESVKFDQLLSEADYISLHIPLSDATHHLFGSEQFKKMKPTACIINTARGGLIDEAALVRALTDGQIAGAGLDVTDPEPARPDNPLIKMNNVLITAHTSFYSEGSIAELGHFGINNVIDVLGGRWPRHLANPDVKNRTNCRLKT